MADETQVTDIVEETVETAGTVETALTEQPADEQAIDWDAMPSDEAAPPVVEETAPVVDYPAPRGAWDFTNRQRVILALLIWLNILMFIVGYLAVTGRLRI